MNEEAQNGKAQTDVSRPIQSFWGKYKGKIGVAVMVIYLLLLGLGTIGEIWEVEWILDLPIFRSVGKWDR